MILKPHSNYNTILISDLNFAFTRTFEDVCIDFRNVFLTSVSRESVILMPDKYVYKIGKILNRRRIGYVEFIDGNL